MLNKSSLILVICSLGLAACQTTAHVYDETNLDPNFSGNSLPITTPILLKYRPHTLVTITKVTYMRMTQRGESANSTMITHGEQKQIARGNNIERVIYLKKTIYATEGLKGKEREKLNKTINLNGSVTSLFTPSGKLMDIKYDVPKLDTNSPKEVKKTIELLDMLPLQFPTQRLREGDTLYDVSDEKKLSGLLFKTAMSGKVLGRSIFNDRDVIVVDINGYSIIETNKKSTSSKSPINGYFLVDIKTGITVFSEVNIPPMGLYTKIGTRTILKVDFPS
jgi:hypothetical protein